jgi:hypothetical protein
VRVLLITGAGASRNLGAEVLPLMPDWSDALCEALDEKEQGLARASHLTPGLSGPDFEKNLGLLLRWEQVRHLEERFQGLGGPQPGSHTNEVVKARTNASRRMALVMEAINTTLFEQFGQRRVDDGLAAMAYGELLEALGDPKLILATTNYDRSGEAALEVLGHQVDTGFRPRPQGTPTLEPAELISDKAGKTPVIHLHGAVGWYEREGRVGDYQGDLPYTPELGTPVVLYPDPEKDPTNDAVVSELWAEFEKTVDLVDSILVVGHSLHDPALVRSLRAIAPSKPVTVSVLHPEERKAAQTKIPGAIAVQMEFGPTLKTEKDLRQIVERGSRPAHLEFTG